jgi:Haem-degrading
MFRKWLQLATGLLVVAACGQANSASLVASQKLPWATAEKLAAEAVRVCEERGYSVAAAVVDPSGRQQVVIRGDAAPAHTLSVARTSAGLRLNALAERCKDGPPDHGASPKTFAHHQLVVQIRQAIEWNARIPMVLEVIADIARQEEDRLEPGGYRRAGD